MLISAYGRRVGIEFFDIFRFWRSEHVMTWGVVLAFFLGFKEWKIKHPCECKLVRVVFIFSQVGPVGSVSFHDVFVVKARPWLFLYSFFRKKFFHESRKKFFGKKHYVFLCYKAHLHIKLSELRLTISAGIFVAHAPRHLIIALKPRNHEKLFILLGRLREGIERT